MGPEMNPSLPSSLLLFKNNLDVIKIISNQWREKLHKNNIFNFKNLTRERVPNKTLPPPKENITCFITLPRDKWPLTFLFCKTSYRAGHWRSHVYDSFIIHYSSQIKYRKLSWPRLFSFYCGTETGFVRVRRWRIFWKSRICQQWFYYFR